MWSWRIMRQNRRFLQWKTHFIFCTRYSLALSQIAIAYELAYWFCVFLKWKEKIQIFNKYMRWETSLRTFIYRLNAMFALCLFWFFYYWCSFNMSSRKKTSREILPWVSEWVSASVCSIHMQIVHIKSFLLHLNDNNVYNNNNIRTHIIW